VSQLPGRSETGGKPDHGPAGGMGVAVVMAVVMAVGGKARYVQFCV